MHCTAGTSKFTVILENCVQTNISWYLGDGVSWNGDVFGDLDKDMAENELKEQQKAEERNKLKAQKEREQFVFDSLRVTRPGWEANYQSFQFAPEKEGVPMKGYYITNSGEKVDAIIAYQKPEFFVGDFAEVSKLYICKNESATKVDLLNPDQESNHKMYVDKNTIKAFFIDGKLYSNIENVGWRILLTEGAIHSFITVVKVELKGQTSYQSFTQIQKLGGTVYGSVLTLNATKNMLIMMEDAPEIIAAYENGERDINESVIEYNRLYEEANPGKLNYLFGSDYGRAEFDNKYGLSADQNNETSVNSKNSTEVSDYEKEVISDIDDANWAEPIDWFKGRPSTPNPGVRSAKPEISVKKESFVERLKRIHSDGNKVGVLIKCGNLVINPKSFSEGITKAIVKGSYGPLSGLDKLAAQVVNQLSDGFGVDVFETVDYSKIPVKGGANGIMDDWWSTKYKIIFIYELKPYYNAYYKTNTATGKKGIQSSNESRL